AALQADPLRAHRLDGPGEQLGRPRRVVSALVRGGGDEPGVLHENVAVLVDPLLVEPPVVVRRLRFVVVLDGEGGAPTVWPLLAVVVSLGDPSGGHRMPGGRLSDGLQVEVAAPAG